MYFQIIQIIKLVKKTRIMKFSIVTSLIKKMIRINNWYLRNFNNISSKNFKIFILIFGQIVGEKYGGFYVIQFTNLYERYGGTAGASLYNLCYFLVFLFVFLDYFLKHMFDCSILATTEWIQVLHLSENLTI